MWRAMRFAKQHGASPCNITSGMNQGPVGGQAGRNGPDAVSLEFEKEFFRKRFRVKKELLY